jgi:hypothetical protein
MMLTLAQTVARLDKFGVPYEKEMCSSNGFWGIRLIFADRKAMRKAEKVLDNQHIQAYHDRFALTFL